MPTLDDLKKQLVEARLRVDDLEKKIQSRDIDTLKRRFETAGYHEDGEAWDYVRALERCRPWVIKNKIDGRLIRDEYETLFGDRIVMAESKEAALRIVEEGLVDGDWEVVQWDGTDE